MADPSPNEIDISVTTTAEQNIALTIDGATYVFAPEEARRLAEMIERAAGSSFYRTRRATA